MQIKPKKAYFAPCFMFTAATGVSFLQFVNTNSIRTMFIFGIALFLGVSVPQYFTEYTANAGHGPADTHARWVCFFPIVLFPSLPFMSRSKLNMYAFFFLVMNHT